MTATLKTDKIICKKYFKNLFFVQFSLLLCDNAKKYHKKKSVIKSKNKKGYIWNDSCLIILFLGWTYKIDYKSQKLKLKDYDRESKEIWIQFR